MVQKSTVVTEGVRDAEFLESEASGRRSREQVTLVQDAAVYVAGTVLMAAGANMVRYDGSGDAAGVLLQEIDATAANTDGTAIVRDAEVTKDRLVFLAAATQPQMDTAYAKLAESSLIAR